MKVNGWTLLFHGCMADQLKNLAEAYKSHLDTGKKANANVKTFAAIAKLTLDEIPSNPQDKKYRQGKTLGKEYKHWFRAKFFSRFRLFFRYDSKSKTIIYAWVNDNSTLRKAGDKNDPYAVFRGMLENDSPPDNWNDLVAASGPLTEGVAEALKETGKK